MSRGGRDLDCKIYVGDLARDTNEKDIERAFSYYGRLRSVWVARNPAGFAFVEYEDPRDADDAVRGLDGTSINGVRVRVENSTGKVRPKPWLRGGGGGGGGRSGGRPGGGRRPFHPDDRCYECGESGHYAYDCPRYKSRGRRHSRSRSRSPRRRSYSRSRSRSRDRRRDSRDRSSRDRDRSSKDRYAASRSRTRSRSRSARSVPRNDD